jgi:cysteine synthase A
LLNFRSYSIKSTVLDTIGRTPIIKIQRLAPEGRNLFIKNESTNPTGSVKARMALAIIEVYIYLFTFSRYL